MMIDYDDFFDSRILDSGIVFRCLVKKHFRSECNGINQLRTVTLNSGQEFGTVGWTDSEMKTFPCEIFHSYGNEESKMAFCRSHQK